MKLIIAIICVLVVWGFLAGQDFDDIQIQNDHYSDMVCAGAWPDYKELGIECQVRQVRQDLSNNQKYQ